MHVNPLLCYILIMWLVSNIITKDENENSELAFTFCMFSSQLAFFLKKNLMYCHTGVMSGLQMFGKGEELKS